MPEAAFPPVRIAQVGLGYWGANLLRTFMALPEAEVLLACDRDPRIRQQAAATHRGLTVTAAYDDLLSEPAVEAVAIATETATHYLLAEAALRAGKHVFVEKPLTETVEQAERLIELARARDLRLMVGHLLRYHPAYRHVEELVRQGHLGDIRYLYTTRVNLGIVRRDENAFDSLAPHDLAVARALLGGEATAVAARGAAFIRDGVEDVVFAAVTFGDAQLAHVHTSWLDPHKVRRLTVVGSRRMAVVDDMEPAEKVRIYDKGVELDAESGYAGYPEALSLRSGDVLIPRIAPAEPLREECRHFVECVRTGATPRTDGAEGMAVVRILTAARQSLRCGGAAVPLHTHPPPTP